MVLFTDVTAKLADSPFTVEWLLDNLSTNDKKFAILEQKYTIKNVAANDISDGKGLASKVYKVEIEFHEITEPYLVILKVPGTESLAKTSETGESPIGEKDLAYIHNKECDFYTKFAEHIDTVLPKVYKAQKWILGEQPGALLMSFIDNADNMTLIADTNIVQAFDAVRHLASVQAYFLSLPPSEWQGKYDFTLYESMAEKQFFDTYLTQLKERQPGMFDEGIDILLKFTRQKKFFRYTLHDIYKDVGLPIGFSHGDFSNNNFLWKTNPDGSFANELAAIIDWQTMHEGCLTNDLARFMAMGVNGEARRAHEDEILQCYYDTLRKILEKRGQRADFTLDQVKRAYRGGFVGHTVFTLLAGPFLLKLQEWEDDDIQKYLVRAKLALEDGIERLKELPEEKLID